MVNIDTINMLIEQIPTIKTLFVRENLTMFSAYNRNTRTREHSGIDLQTIYKNPDFLQWKDRLCFELGQIKGDDFIDEIIALTSRFTGWNDKTCFERLASKLCVLREHLDQYQENSTIVQVENDSRISEKEICDKLLRALLKLQRNHYYNSESSEDTMNDYIRDMLDESYIIKDQTRQGSSESGKEAGEVDIQVCYDRLPVVMIEGVKVSSLERDKLDIHMNKVLTKYDPNGCSYAFLIIYTTVKDFDSGYKRIFDYFDRYEYPFPKETHLSNEDTGYGELKHAQIVLNRNGQKTRVHIWSVHIVTV